MSRYGQYGLNLYKSVKALARFPVPMTTRYGNVVPALYYTEKLEAAIQWLVDRYNDGTLKVEGYDYNLKSVEGSIRTWKMRKEEMIDVKGYMTLTDLSRESGMSLNKIRRIAKKAGAYCPEYSGKKVTTLINVRRFFYYIDNLAKNQEYETFVSVEEAVQLTGFSEKEVYRKIRRGEFKTKKQDKTQSYKIYRTSLYKDPSFITKPKIFEKELKKYGDLEKGEDADGKNDSSNG